MSNRKGGYIASILIFTALSEVLGKLVQGDVWVEGNDEFIVTFRHDDELTVEQCHQVEKVMLREVMKNRPAYKELPFVNTDLDTGEIGACLVFCRDSLFSDRFTFRPSLHPRDGGVAQIGVVVGKEAVSILQEIAKLNATVLFTAKSLNSTLRENIDTLLARKEALEREIALLKEKAA